MRKSYTRFPLDNPSVAFKGERAVWEPMLWVRIGISGKSASPRFLAVVDSGSPCCIFKAELGRLAGINVEKGEEDVMGGIVAGPREAIYFHRVNLYVESDWVIPIRAGFMKKLHPDGILGRGGFFENFQILFDHSSSPPALEIKKIEKAQ